MGGAFGRGGDSQLPLCVAAPPPDLSRTCDRQAVVVPCCHVADIRGEPLHCPRLKLVPKGALPAAPCGPKGATPKGKHRATFPHWSHLLSEDALSAMFPHWRLLLT